nr:immunoglobulin heavy chain junction region [Macaca mulatta]
CARDSGAWNVPLDVW